MRCPRVIRAAIRAITAALLLATATAAVSAAASPASAAQSGRIRFGAAVWWSCADRQAPGPPSLACPRPYTPRYEEILRDNFDTVVPENELKMPWIHPTPFGYDFRVADRLVAWAQAHGKKVRGHTLLWGSELPAWMNRFPLNLVGPGHSALTALDANKALAALANAIPGDRLWTRDMLLHVMKDHITTTIRHFREKFPGVVSQWDVVNEAIDRDGDYVDNLFLRVIGPDYIEKAYEYAHEADPDAVLLYNEFEAQKPNARSRAVLAMAADFRRRGIPLDGIGIEMHVDTVEYPTRQELRGLIQGYAKLGLRVEISELDVRAPATPSGVKQQEKVYKSIFAACRAEPSCTSITIWGVADPYSWRGSDGKPLLFDQTLRPKRFLTDLLAMLTRRVRPRARRSQAGREEARRAISARPAGPARRR